MIRFKLKCWLNNQRFYILRLASEEDDNKQMAFKEPHDLTTDGNDSAHITTPNKLTVTQTDVDNNNAYSEIDLETEHRLEQNSAPESQYAEVDDTRGVRDDPKGVDNSGYTEVGGQPPPQDVEFSRPSMSANNDSGNEEGYKGWKENTLYSKSDKDDDKDGEEGWVDNTVYAGSYRE